MKPMRLLLFLFPLPFILLVNVESKEYSCATLSDYIDVVKTSGPGDEKRKSTLNRRSPFLKDSFPDEASVRTLRNSDYIKYDTPEPKVYGMTLKRKGGDGKIMPLKGWVHTVIDLPPWTQGASKWPVASAIAYLHK
jgi:hypothetical protein